MKTCPACQQTYPEDFDSCPRDGSRLVPESRDERECPYCAEMILKKAHVCKHCGRDVEPLGEGDSSVQTPLPATPQAISPAAQSQASGRATTVRPSVMERVPQFGLLSDGPHESVLPRQRGSGPQFGSISEPPGKIKHVALGAAVVLVMVIVGAVYFSEQKTQREQERAEKARQEVEQRQESLAAERAEVTPQGEQSEAAPKEAHEEEPPPEVAAMAKEVRAIETQELGLLSEQDRAIDQTNAVLSSSCSDSDLAAFAALGSQTRDFKTRQDFLDASLAPLLRDPLLPQVFKRYPEVTALVSKTADENARVNSKYVTIRSRFLRCTAHGYNP